MSGAMTEIEKLNGLLSYLDRLIALEGVGYTCKREIAECIEALRRRQALSSFKPAIEMPEEVSDKLDAIIAKVGKAND